MTINNSNLPLGKKSDYISIYDKTLLVAIPRQKLSWQLTQSIQSIQLPQPTQSQQLMQHSDSGGNNDSQGKARGPGVEVAPGAARVAGVDIWNCYELSWLNLNGRPEVRVLRFWVESDSPCIVESKSVKLYLNSFNGTKFANEMVVAQIITNDLSVMTRSQVRVSLFKLTDGHLMHAEPCSGICIDHHDVKISDYVINKKLLALDLDASAAQVTELLYSNLLKSNCLVTHQPDWGSIFIQYTGPKIAHDALLSYIISFRNHNEFHEQCTERIFNDIMDECRPLELTVQAQYTRRGGVDINPYRTNATTYVPHHWANIKLYHDIRQ